MEGVDIYENAVPRELCEQIISNSTFVIKARAGGGHHYDMDTYPERVTEEPFASLQSIFDEFTEKYGPTIPRMWMNIMRYEDGQGMIAKHADTHGPDKGKRKRSYTVMIYLNDVNNGGETVFFKSGKEELVVKPEAGKAVVIAGNVMHEARAPRGTDKYIALIRHVEY